MGERKGGVGPAPAGLSGLAARLRGGSGGPPSVREGSSLPGGWARLQSLVDSSNRLGTFGFCIFDSESRYLAVNDALARINGIPVGAHLGRTVEEVVPDIGARLAGFVQRSIRTERPLRHVEIRSRSPLGVGNCRHWLVNFLPLRLGVGAAAVAHTVIEVTDCTTVEAAIEDLFPRSDAPEPTGLSPREAEVLALIGLGKTSKEISAALFISVETVGNHRKRICQKLGLHSTAELASYGSRLSWQRNGPNSGSASSR